MKKIALFGSILAFFTNMSFQAPTTKTLHDFKVKAIDGSEFDFAKLKGKKVLIVNTASECGYTVQYADLEKLYQTYKDKNLVIVGFPCNDFGGQEPGTEKEIATFCTKEYGVTFPMMAKVNIKGNDVAPIYKWLTSKALNGKSDAEVKWNFFKFMIDENGNWVDMGTSKDKPLEGKIVDWIRK